MIFVFINPSLDIVGYPNVKSSGFTGHDINIVVLHSSILAAVEHLGNRNQKINRFLDFARNDEEGQLHFARNDI